VADVCGNQWNPSICLGDFDESFRRSITMKYHSVVYVHALFHFLRENCAHLAEIGGGKDLEMELKNHLKVLYYSSNFEEFRENLTQFESHWERVFPTYLDYFRFTWGDRGIFP